MFTCSRQPPALLHWFQESDHRRSQYNSLLSPIFSSSLKPLTLKLIPHNHCLLCSMTRWSYDCGFCPPLSLLSTNWLPSHFPKWNADIWQPIPLFPRDAFWIAGVYLLLLGGSRVLWFAVPTPQLGYLLTRVTVQQCGSSSFLIAFQSNPWLAQWHWCNTSWLGCPSPDTGLNMFGISSLDCPLFCRRCWEALINS